MKKKKQLHDIVIPTQQSTPSKKMKVAIPIVDPKLLFNRLHMDQFVPMTDIVNTNITPGETYESSDSEEDDNEDEFDDSLDLAATTYFSCDPLNDRVDELPDDVHKSGKTNSESSSTFTNLDINMHEVTDTKKEFDRVLQDPLKDKKGLPEPTGKLKEDISEACSNIFCCARKCGGMDMNFSEE